MALDAEVDVHRATTAAWIDSDPFTVALERPTYEGDGAGGRIKTGETVLPVQTFRMDASTNQSIQFVTLPSGTNVPIRFRLVGPHDADVAEGDNFTIEGRRFDVVYVRRPSYQRVAAEVEYRG